MTRLLVHVEGQTEEEFVNEVLRPHLFDHGFTSVVARLIGNARQRGDRGGIRPWQTVRSDITKHLKEDPGCLATTMVDYYGLPQTSPHDWPGRRESSGIPFNDKANMVQDALMADICRSLGSQFDKRRFVPYVIMHEFEGLLFSNCDLFSDGIGRPELASQFQEIRSQFSSPEEINDSTLTAPSKRIKHLVTGYQKPLHGVLAVLNMGLSCIKTECPNFRNWLTRLESLPYDFDSPG